MTDVTAYRWIVEESYLQVAGCVTVVRGLDVAGTVLAFGGDPSVSPEPRERLLDLDGYIEVAAVGQLDDVVVAMEPNGFQGIDERWRGEHPATEWLRACSGTSTCSAASPTRWKETW